MSTGAPLLSGSFDGRELQAAGDAAGNPEQGGYDNEFSANGRPNTGRVIQTPTGWRIPDQTFDASHDDWAYLNEKKNNGIQMKIVYEYKDVTLSGKGIIEGKMSRDTMAGTISVTVAGPGELEPL